MAPESETPPPIAFVGLGTMGGPIAARLLAAGTPLVVHNRDRAKAEPLLSAGASWADTPKQAARLAAQGLAFVMVSDVRAVRAVAFGRRGLLAGASAGLLVVNLSTIAPEESRAVAGRFAARGVHYLEAPVGGSADAARDGQLVVYAGGDAADVARARPLLERFAVRVEHLGAVGLGAAMKLVNNLVTVTTVAVDAEALALGEALGLERARTLELLLAGSGQSAMLARKREAFLAGRYPVQFKLELAEKDLRLIGRSASEVGARTPIAREAQRLAAEAMRDGYAGQDFSVVLEAARRRRAGTSGTAVLPPAPPEGPVGGP